MRRRVRGVMADSSCSGVILNPEAASVSTTTGTPPARRTMSVYETQ